MQKQLVASFLCALLASTIAHDYLHHQHPPSAQKRVAKESHHLLSHLGPQKRASNEVCDWVCPVVPPVHGNGSIQININVTTSIISLVNVTANVGIAIDINANLIGLFNGTDGTVIIIDIQAQTGVLIQNQNSPLVWIAANMSFEAYINSLSSLKVVLDFGLQVGVKFSVSDAPKLVLQIVGSILIDLGLSLGVDIKGDLSNALQVVLQLGKNIVKALGGVLRIVKGTTVIVGVGLVVLVEVLEAIGVLVGKIEGGIETLVKHGVQLELGVILGAASGLEAVTYILGVLVAAGVSLGAVVSVGVILNLISQLSVNASSSYNNLVNAVVTIWALLRGKANISEVIKVVIVVSVGGQLSADASANLTASLKALLQVLQKVGGSAQALFSDLQGLINGTLKINGVSLKDVLNILLSAGKDAALTLVVRILIALGKAVNIGVSISQLLLNIIKSLNSSSGIQWILKLIPGLHIDGDVSGSGDGNLLAKILKGINWSDLISGGLDIVNILKKLPVIGQIYSELSSALKAASNGKLSLSIVIKSNGALSVVREIINLIKEAIQGSISVSVGWSWSVDEKHYHKHENRHLEHVKHAIHEKTHHQH